MMPQKHPNTENPPQQYLVQFYNPQHQPLGPQIDIPDSATPQDLSQVLNSLQSTQNQFLFFLQTLQVQSTLQKACQSAGFSSEAVVPLTVHPQSLFRVSPATRATSCLQGHTQSILSVQFSPDGSSLASSGGDTTVRLWDIQTETPFKTLRGHTNWVLMASWSPDGLKLASAGVDGTIRLWNPQTGQEYTSPLTGHRKWVTSLAWKPYHTDPQCSKLVSSSKDSTIKIWDVNQGVCVLTIQGHSNTVTKVIWGGQGMIFSSSQDRTIKVWDQEGRCIQTLKGHGHWVNSLSISTEYMIRTAFFDPFTEERPESTEQKLGVAHQRYLEVLKKGERLVSCSDDFTLFLWAPPNQKAITRMTGHQQPVNQVVYSPDGQFIISASFDKSIKLWEGVSGAFIANFRGHVGAVYQVGWSPDSRMIVSASKDSTLKIWSLKSKKLLVDLPGHADQVYAVDWAPDGGKIASGSRDRILSIWRN